MTWWHSLILGLIQGLAEFLPVSSSGHLVLFREIFNISGNYIFFDIMLHVGTLIAVAAVFYREIIALFKPPFKMLGLLILSAIPAALIGILLDDVVESFFESGKYLCFFFLITAIILLLTEYLSKRNKEPKEIGLKTAAIMGLMQGVAVFPGISRSGSTIFGGTVSGAKRTSIAKFSFLMSIPIILGSALMQAIKIDSFTSINWVNIFVGMSASAVSGFFAIKFMLKIISKANYKWFALYMIIISFLSFLFLFLDIA